MTPDTNAEDCSQKLSSFGASFKDSGMKKLFILAIAKNVSENYRNILMLWNALQLTSNFDFLSKCTYAIDLKMAYGQCAAWVHGRIFYTSL